MRHRHLSVSARRGTGFAADGTVLLDVDDGQGSPDLHEPGPHQFYPSYCTMLLTGGASVRPDRESGPRLASAIDLVTEDVHLGRQPVVPRSPRTARSHE